MTVFLFINGLHYVLYLLLRISMPMHAERNIVMANLSVCLPVTCWYCIETNEHIVKLFPPSLVGHDSGFLSVNTVTKFQGELPQWGH